MVSGLEVEVGSVVAVRLGAERVAVDACVVALGSRTPALLAPLGIDVPVYPVKGYSLTIPARDEAAAPVSTVLDETYKVAVTRFDSRIRIGGMAELAGHDLTLRPQITIDADALRHNHRMLRRLHGRHSCAVARARRRVLRRRTAHRGDRVMAGATSP